jgi:2'-5' RNA ligase
MHGIVSLLDTAHYALVEEIWADLEREFGVRGVYATPYPHFSYQVASHYNLDILVPILHRFAASHTPFQVNTGGIGIFTGTAPVIYIGLPRGPQLASFHQELWRALEQTGDGIQQYYHPDYWVPHITIGFRDITIDKLADITRYLGGKDFSWQVNIDNLALIYDTGTKQELKHKFMLH